MERKVLIYKYLASDIASSLLVWFLFMIFRLMINDGVMLGGLMFYFPNYNFYGVLLLYPFFCIFLHYLSGIYLNPHTINGISLFFKTIFVSAIIAVAIFFVLLLDDVVISYQYYYYSLLVLFVLQFLLSYLTRLAIYSDIKRKIKSKKWTINTLIIGTGKNAARVGVEFEKHEIMNTLKGYVSVGYPAVVCHDRILGGMNQLSAIIQAHQIDEAVVVLDDPDDEELFSIINQLYKYNIDIRFSPRLFEVLTGLARINKPGMSALVSITQSSITDWQACIKRFIDLTISVVSLIVLFPFLLVIVWCIKSNSPGTVFYRQERIGRNGKPFNIIKFRTMYSGSEGRLPQLSSVSDDRITSVGRVLRKYRLDEIPQFWNIIKGDMSLVGPRPERLYYINQIIKQAPYYCLLYRIRPGLTSWGPIKVGYTENVDKMIERLKFDIMYLDNMSLITDLKIMIYTIEILFNGKGV